MGLQFGDKIGCTIKLNICLKTFVKKWGQKLAEKIRWNNWVEKWSGKI